MGRCDQSPQFNLRVECEVMNGEQPIPGAKTACGDERPEYLGEVREGPPYAKVPETVRRGQSGDKLRRKAFERKL